MPNDVLHFCETRTPMRFEICEAPIPNNTAVLSCVITVPTISCVAHASYIASTWRGITVSNQIRHTIGYQITPSIKLRFIESLDVTRCLVENSVNSIAINKQSQTHWAQPTAIPSQQRLLHSNATSLQHINNTAWVHAKRIHINAVDLYSNAKSIPFIGKTRYIHTQCIPVTVIKGGDGWQGTFVAKELVYAYAMWVSPGFHLKVIRTFDAVQSQPALPTTPESMAVVAVQSFLQVTNLFQCPVHLAQIEAVKFARDRHGVDFSQALLSAPAQDNIKPTEEMLEPTELGKLLGLSARAMNSRLESMGLQVRTNSGWLPTRKGMELCTKHSWNSGSKSGYNLKWNANVVKELLEA